ncbi:transposase [Streptomyces sp. NPDC050392]|uniref:transposase n=1 Tax=Streptomyces sp. NPDC050392 TaxID=3155782 RepID=UPI0034197B5A
MEEGWLTGAAGWGAHRPTGLLLKRRGATTPTLRFVSSPHGSAGRPGSSDLGRSGLGSLTRQPSRSTRDGARPEHRQVIDVIAFKFQTGTQWVHLPEKNGNWRGVHNRLRIWAIDGTWERGFTALMAQADEEGVSAEWCRWTPPSSVFTSTLPGPEKRGPGRRAG